MNCWMNCWLCNEFMNLYTGPWMHHVGRHEGQRDALENKGVGMAGARKKVDRNKKHWVCLIKVEYSEDFNDCYHCGGDNLGLP